jgi:hypothetical protein
MISELKAVACCVVDSMQFDVMSAVSLASSLTVGDAEVISIDVLTVYSSGGKLL